MLREWIHCGFTQVGLSKDPERESYIYPHMGEVIYIQYICIYVDTLLVYYVYMYISLKESQEQ